MQATLLQPAPTEHVYYAKWQNRYRWMFFCYPVIGAFQVISGILTHSRSGLIFGVYFLVLAPLMAKNRNNICLVVTPDGVVYHSGKAVLEVPWQDMKYIGRIERRGRVRGYEGIILSRAEWKHLRTFPQPKGWRPPFIPLWNKWTGPWWDRELFDEVFHYAPWLAGEGRR